MPDDLGIRFRLARPSDAQSIAALHADSWQRAYRGMLPDAYLDHEVLLDRAAAWRERFYGAEQPETVTILAERDGELLGFVHSIVDEEPEWGTLLDNLHVRYDTKRLGIGRRLVTETAVQLEERARAPGLYLWVLANNASARRFYERLGGRVAGSGVSHEGGGSAPSLRYWWPELARLSRHLPTRRRPLR